MLHPLVPRERLALVGVAAPFCAFMPKPCFVSGEQVAGMVSRELEAESVVIFDEAHNIDNVCTEALSVDLDKRSLDAASRCLGKISSKVRTGGGLCRMLLAARAAASWRFVPQERQQ